MAPQPSGYVELHLFIHSLIYSTISCSVYPGSAICLEIQRTAASLQSRRGRQTWSPASPAGVHNCQMGSEKSTILWKQVTEGTCLSCKWSGKVSWRKWPSSCNLEKEQKLKEMGGERGERCVHVHGGAFMPTYPSQSEYLTPVLPPKCDPWIQRYVFCVSSQNASQQGHLFFSGEMAIQPQHWGETEMLRGSPMPASLWDLREWFWPQRTFIVGTNIVDLSQGCTWNSGKFSSEQAQETPRHTQVMPSPLS